MATPMRIPAGFTQDMIFQPLGLVGFPDPFFYALYQDDFLHYNNGDYTRTLTGNGTIAQTAADGGAILFTTNSSTPAGTDIASQQLATAGFQLSTSKKWTFLTRIQVADITNPAIVAGLIQTTTTPFTVTDGIYFSKASGSTTFTINLVSGSTVQATATLTNFPMVANTYIDLGFTYDGKSDVLVFAGSGLAGSVPSQNTEPLGPMARLSGVGALTLTSAILNPTLAVQSGTATSKTMQSDFALAAKER